MYGLDLFSGIGGITEALDGYVQPVAYCENDRYSQAVLLSRMGRNELPLAPIWTDVRTLRGDDLPRAIDCIYGGFPCQDISVAGLAIGLEGKRSGLFFEILRLAEEIQPTFLFLENVPNIRTKGLIRVVTELAYRGYDCRWCSISAEEIGANHKRCRWFLLAYSDRESKSRLSGGETTKLISPRTSRKFQSRDNWWKTEPELDRMANGIPNWHDRNRALGNAVVPAQAREAFERLSGLKPV